MRELKFEQGSAGWLECRTGRITASRISDVLATLKRGGESAQRRNYRRELIAERLSGRSENHYVSPEMEHGIECEPIARAAYEVGCDVMVDEVGFVLHPTMDFAGGSPDGLVGDDGLIEIKCGKTTTHLDWMAEGVVPEDHQAQIMWNLACTGRKWADFISFDPRLPEGLRIFIVRMDRDEERIAAMEEEVMRFNLEIEEAIAKLSGRIVHKPAPPVDTRTPEQQCEAMADAMEMVP